MSTNRSNAREISALWNRMADSYNRFERTGGHHKIGHEILHENLNGSVLCVGGLWANARLDEGGFEVTVLDISERMLKHYASQGVRTILGDACDMNIESDSYDHVVFPLMLHHLTGRGARDSRFLARCALKEANRVLKRGGKIWIKEIIVPDLVYGMELSLARLTKHILNRYGVPLVVLHSSRFWISTLKETGFSNVSMQSCDVRNKRWNDMIPPIIGIPFFKIPRILVPVKNVMIQATAEAAR